MERELERAAELETSDLLKLAKEWRSLRAARGAAMRAQGSRTVSAGVHVWHDGSRVHCAFASVSEAPEFCCFVCDCLDAQNWSQMLQRPTVADFIFCPAE